MTPVPAPDEVSAPKPPQGGKGGLRLWALQQLRAKGRLAFSHAKARDGSVARCMKSEFVEGGATRLADAIHYEVTRHSSPTPTPLWKQVLFALPKRMPITIWVREDGEFVYCETPPWRHDNNGPTKGYPLEVMSSAHLTFLEEEAFA